MPHYKYDNFRVEDFPDTGCNLAPKCLTCPLPRCKHDLPLRTGITQLRAAEIAVLSAQGLTGQQMVDQLGITRRSVQRVKSLMREGPVE